MSKVKIAEANRFMVECLRAVGVNETAAQLHAKLLLEADKIGHPSHGLNRLEIYINDIVRGLCKPNNEPCIVKQSASTAVVDAKNVLGSTASDYAMDIAIKKAKETGVGWVTVKGSNHNGMQGWWAKKAASQGLIGIACSNSSPLMAPTRSKQSALGTNPLSVVAAASNGELFYLDIATTAVALGKIEMLRRKKEKVPAGWALGTDGYETNDPDVAIKAGCLLPLGGTEKTSGYKGYGLAAMVELFCGISSGSNYSTKIRSWNAKNPKDDANLGHCMMAINPECFVPGFGDRLTDCLQIWRKLEPIGSHFSLAFKGCNADCAVMCGLDQRYASLSAIFNRGQQPTHYRPRTIEFIHMVDPRLPVLVPGDKERTAWCLTEEQGTVSFVKDLIDSCEALAKKLKVKPMEVGGELNSNTAKHNECKPCN